MKIGLLSPFLPEKDGIAIYSNNILVGLGEKSKDIVTIGRKGSKADYIIDFKSFSLKNGLEKIIEKENLDAIHIQYVASFFSRLFNLNLISSLNLSIPVIVTLHEVHYSIRNFKDKILEFIEKEIIKRSKIVIVHTPNQKEFLEKKYRVNNIQCIYHGLNLFKTHERKGNNLLCFGMISKNKGVEYLVKSMDYLPGCSLTIAGNFVDKKIEKELKAQIKDSKLKIKTEFAWIGEEKKAQYYNDADLVVLPHIWAPYQSGILHNAVAFGLPVVAAKTGALWEIVDLFKLGEIVEPKNPNALAEGIKKVFKDYSKYKKGISDYRKAANWQRVAEEHLKIYKEVKK